MYPNLKILFVCNGNASRGQIAESYYNKFTDSSDATSAVIGPISSRESKILPEILQIMNEVKVDISSKEVKLITEEMVIKSDRIVLFCKKENCPDFLLKHKSIYLWEVEDLELEEISTRNFRLIRDKIERLVFSKLLRIEY